MKCEHETLEPSCFLCRWCFVYNMHQTSIHNHFHKSTFFSKIVTAHKIFLVPGHLLSIVKVLLPFCMFWKLCLHSAVIALWQMFSLSLDLIKLRETEHRILHFCTCMLLHLCGQSLRKGYNVGFFMSRKNKADSLFWFQPFFKLLLGCSQNRNVCIPLLLLFLIVNMLNHWTIL